MNSQVNEIRDWFLSRTSVVMFQNHCPVPYFTISQSATAFPFT